MGLRIITIIRIFVNIAIEMKHEQRFNLVADYDDEYYTLSIFYVFLNIQISRRITN